MATKNLTLRLRDVELAVLDELAYELGKSRTDAIRVAVQEARERRGLVLRQGERFLAELKSRFRVDAQISVQLDDTFNAFAQVEGERRDDIYVFSHPARAFDQDFAGLWLGDLESDFRLFLGLVPLRSGVPLSFALHDLSPDMTPKPVAYWTGN